MNTFNPFILGVNGNCRDLVNAIIIHDLLKPGHGLSLNSGPTGLLFTSIVTKTAFQKWCAVFTYI